MRFSGLISRPSFDTDTSSTFASVKLFFHANQMLQRREREFSFAAWPSLEEEHLFPNKSKIKKNDTPQLDCVSGNVGI